MTDWRRLEDRIAQRVQFSRRPVAVAFLDAAPRTSRTFTGKEPSGCSFWRLAAEGRTVFIRCRRITSTARSAATPSTSTLSPERAQETEQTLGLMFQVGYIRPEEVAGIPRLPATPAAIVYSALGDAPVAPSVVLFACRPASAMLLQEAAVSAGKSATLPTLGRPTCMALPAALAHGTVASLGCIGNRVYTGLSEDELYVAIRGPTSRKSPTRSTSSRRPTPSSPHTPRAAARSLPPSE